MADFLTERADIREAQESMRETFRQTAQVIPSATIGFPGGHTEADVDWHQQHAFWGSFNNEPPREKGAGRYWNVFGTEDPTHYSGSLSIVCEVNPSHAFDNPYVAGFFGRAEAGRTIVLHKGKLNRSSKPGLTMEFFWQHFEGKSVEIDGRCYALLCEIGSSTMVADLARFVDESQRIRKLHAALPSIS